MSLHWQLRNYNASESSVKFIHMNLVV